MANDASQIPDLIAWPCCTITAKAGVSDAPEPSRDVVYFALTTTQRYYRKKQIIAPYYRRYKATSNGVGGA
jgi:hypothetical protein